MIRHLVLFDVHPDTDPAAVDTLRQRLSELPSVIPGIVSYEVVGDLGLRDTNSTMGVVAVFTDSDAFLAYIAHPAHQAVVSECITPIVSKRSSLQYEI